MTNAFDLFQISPTFAMDLDALEKTYLALSQQHHPDRVAQGSTREKLEATMATATINHGYETLRNPLKRGYHLLKILDPATTVDQEQTIKNSALLMEAMEDREALEEAATSESIAHLIFQTETKHTKALEAILETFEAQHLDQVPLALYRYRYYDKFLTDAQTKLDQYALTA